MPKIITPEIEQQVRQIFYQMRGPVEILFFTSSDESCEFCDATRGLLEELVALSDKLSLKVYDIVESAELATKYHVDKTPGIALTNEQGLDYGIRISGIPAGHEFTSLIHSLVLVSRRESGLSDKTREFLRLLERPLFLQVFVTPT
jgi:glutaredoxin-like protein